MNRYSLKLISRTIIASNSNSNKTFGVNISIYKDDDLIKSRDLTYNKNSSTAINESKVGWNYTKAGFWLEELNNLENMIIKLTLLKGSPDVEIKLILDKINLRTSKKEIMPITKNEEYIVSYKLNEDDSLFKKSDNWYLLNNNQIQYKINGPKIIRFISRGILNDQINENLYIFELRENGRFIANYNYFANLSTSNAFIKDKDILLSGYNSSFFNVPKGINYYSFYLDENSNLEVLLKLEVYENKN